MKRLTTMTAAALVALAAMAGAAHAEENAAGTAGRPTGLSVGIGAGWNFPAALDTPNTVSVRFRLASGMTLEPVAVLAIAGDSTDNGAGGETSNGNQEFTVGSLVRLILGDSGPVDLELVVGGLFSFERANPEGDDNSQSDILFSVPWGLGVTWWKSEHWSFSFTALNPLLLIAHGSQEQPGGDPSSQTSYSFGAVWSPDVELMVHLFW